MGAAVGLVGDVLGGVTGTLSGKQVYNPQAPTFDRSAFDPNEQERKLTDALMARAMGEATSPAEMQMQMGLDQATRQAQAQAVAARGVSPALAARLASQTGAQLRSDMVGQGSLLRAQEQARAETAAGSMLGDQRAGRAAAQELGVRSQLGVEGMKQSAAESAATRQANMLGGLGQAAVMGAMMSDERAKKNVEPGDAEVKSFLDALKAKQYDYKNPAHGQGKHVSPMAQDLEKTQVGRQMVIDTPAGKIVDYGKGMGAMLAAQAHLNERLKKVEAKKMADGGLVIPKRYQGFAQSLAASPQVIDYGASKAGQMSNESIQGLAGMMKGSGAKPSLGAQQGTSINMTPIPEPGPNGWIDDSLNRPQGMMVANQGAMVPGKAKVMGDDEVNDTVPALLSPGEMVVPRTVVNAGPKAVKGFAEAILEKEKRGQA